MAIKTTSMEDLAQQMKSAVLFLTYRRFGTAEKVFESIREAKPPRLYFASNAPNPENKNEEQRVDKVRGLLDRIDWNCEVHTLFRDEHLSVKYSIPSAIDWFFENEETGIILEDDCLPSQSFYPFCDELLKKYRDNSSIMMISGVNFQDGIIRGEGSYYFSKHFHIWGWATWKNRWNKYDICMTDWPYQKSNNMIDSVFCRFLQRLYWSRVFDMTYKGEIETWDYQWNYTCWKNNGLSCTPNINLVSNIGFGDDSTFTKDSSSNASKIPLSEIDFPLTYVDDTVNCEVADLYTSNNHYKITFKRFFIKIIKIIKIVYKGKIK